MGKRGSSLYKHPGGWMGADHLQLVSPFPALQKHLVGVGITPLFHFNMNVSIYIILLLFLASQ